MSQGKITLVDATLRDGSHPLRHSYTCDQVAEIAGGLDKCGIELIELSHGDGLGGSSYTYGFSKTSEFELIEAAASQIKNAKLDVLLLPGIGTIANLKQAYDCGARAVRVATHVTEADVSAEHIYAAKDLGMMAVGFLMMIHKAPVERLVEEAKKMESYGADYVNLADSAGYLMPGDVKERVEAVEVSKVDESLQPIPGTEEVIPCDTLLLSIGLIPENEVSQKAGVELNPATNGAIVNERFETNVPGIFSCGNVLHVHDLADNVTAEANNAGRNAAEYALGLSSKTRENILKVNVVQPIGYSVPSSITKDENASIFFRVKRPIESACMVVKSNGKELLRGKARSYKPSIMECQIVPSKILQEAQDEITLELVEGSEA